jgi:hypothetical protein
MRKGFNNRKRTEPPEGRDWSKKQLNNSWPSKIEIWPNKRAE